MKNFTFLLVLFFCSSLAFAQAEFNWEKTDFSPGNNLKQMAAGDSCAFIAGYGNTFAKTLDGENWNMLNLLEPEYNFTDISILGSVGYMISNRTKIYDAAPDVYHDGVIFKTEDGGTTWLAINSPVFEDNADFTLNPFDTLCFGADFSAIKAVNDSVAYISARWFHYINTSTKEDHSGVFKTTNGGLTWKNVSGDLGGNSMYSMDFFGDKGIMGGSNMLFTADAKTDSLVNIYAQLPSDGTAFIFDFDFVSETEVLLATTGDSVFISNDGGNTFTKFEGIKGGNDILRVNDSTIVVSGNSNKSYVSTNNGQSWNALGIGESVWEIGGVANDSLLLLAKAKIYKLALSDLAAGNYNFFIQNVGTDNLQKIFINNNHLFVIGNDNNLLQSTDSGVTWNIMDVPSIQAVADFLDQVDFDGLSMIGDKGYACFNRVKFVDYPANSEKDDIYWSGGVFYTSDYWETWTSVDVAKLGKENESDPSVNPNHDACNGVNTQYIKCLCDEVVLLYARWYDYTETPKVEHSRVFKSTDAGKNWVAITEDLGSKYLQDIGCNGETFYLVGRELFLKASSADLKSASATITFTNLYPVLDEGENDAMFINSIWAEGNDLFLTTSVDSCYMSTDAGATFKSMGNVKGSSDFYRFDDNSFIMMGTSGKSIFTNDGGENWSDCHPGTTVYTIGGEFNGKLYALARGAFFTTSVADLALKVSTPEIISGNKIDVFYRPGSVVIVSSEKEINRCEVYSVSGTKVNSYLPNNRTLSLNNNEYKTGIYIVKAEIAGNLFTKKIFIK